MQPLRETGSEYPSSSSGSNRSVLTVVEYLRDPAIPTDWMFNVGLRSIWRQTHEQLATTLGPWTTSDLVSPDLSTPGHILIDSQDSFIYYGLYKIDFAFFNGYDIDVVNNVVSYPSTLIGNYPGIAVNVPSTGNRLYLQIVEKRFHSQSLPAELEGGVSGNNCYGNIHLTNDLRATFGSSTFDTHNEWRYKVVIFQQPGTSPPLPPESSTIDSFTTNILLATFDVDNSGNVVNFQWRIPRTSDSASNLLRDQANQPFSTGHRVAFTNSKNLFLDTIAQQVRYNHAKIDSNGNLVHLTTGNANDLHGNYFVIDGNNPTQQASALKNLPLTTEYPEGTRITLAPVLGSLLRVDLTNSGNISTFSILDSLNNLVPYYTVGFNTSNFFCGYSVTFVRIGNNWYIDHTSLLTVTEYYLHQSYDQSLFQWNRQKFYFGTNPSSNNPLFQVTLQGIGTTTEPTLSKTYFEQNVQIGSTTFTGANLFDAGNTYILLRYKKSSALPGFDRGFIEIQLEIFLKKRTGASFFLTDVSTLTTIYGTISPYVPDAVYIWDFSPLFSTISVLNTFLNSFLQDTLYGSYNNILDLTGNFKVTTQDLTTQGLPNTIVVPCSGALWNDPVNGHRLQLTTRWTRKQFNTLYTNDKEALFTLSGKIYT